jgi:beta-lactamase regulating signal transducer with metallopeptidase domain
VADLTALVLGFALTLLLHASVLLGAVWLAERVRLLRDAGWAEIAWRGALIGSLLTASIVTLWTNLPGDKVAARTTAADSAIDRTPLPIPPQPTIVAPLDASTNTDSAALAVAERFANEATLPITNQRDAQARSSQIQNTLSQYANKSNPRTEVPLPATAITYAGNAWLAGACALALLTLWRGLGVYRLTAKSRNRNSRELQREQRIATEIAALYAIAVPKLRVDDSLVSPVVLPGGIVLLPRWTTTLSHDELRALLAHELAHLARRDPFWRIAHHLALAPLFAHPLAWLALRRLDDLAEQQADAAAARLLGDGRPLAECLARCLQQRTVSRPAAPRFALAMAERPGAVVHRVQRLLQEDPMSYNPPSRTLTRAALVLGVLAALALPSLVVTAVADDVLRGSSISIHSDDDGEEMTIRVRQLGYSLEVEMEGEIDFAADESDVVAMADDAELSIEETRDGVTRSIEFTSSGGAIERAYEVEGKAQPFDAAARSWLAVALPDMFRRSGVHAEARAKRILARSGVDGLLAEIDLIEGDYSRSTYLGILFGGAKMSQAQQARALELIRGIDSDYELRRALSMALTSQELAPAQRLTVLSLADEIGSDYELAELLVQTIDAFPLDGPGFDAWSKAAQSIDSDYEHRRVLEAVLEKYGDNPRAVSIALQAAAHIDSDYERRQVLQATATRALAEPQLRRDYLVAADGIGSDYERKEALLTLMNVGPVDAELAIAVLESIDGIGSDYESKEALVALARVMPGEQRVIDRYRQSARRLSDHERGEAERALDRFLVSA